MDESESESETKRVYNRRPLELLISKNEELGILRG